MISAKLKPADEARFAAALQKMVALSGEPVEDILRQQGRLVAVQLAAFTQRVGKTASAGKDQKNDVKKTINTIYIDPLQMSKTISKKAGVKDGNRFRNYIRRRQGAKAKAMIDRLGITRGKGGYRIDVDMFDGGNRHSRWLTGKGKSVLVVMNYKATVPKYRTRKVKNVGALKAGWAQAAEDLGGTRGIPAYAKKGHKTRGHGKVRGKGGKAVLEISNRSNYMIQNRKLTDVFRVQGQNMEKNITRMMQRRLKQTKQKFKV